MRIGIFSIFIAFCGTLSAQNLVTNGDFENGAGGWYFSAQVANNFNGTANFSDPNPHGGNAAARIDIQTIDPNLDANNRIWQIQIVGAYFPVSKDQILEVEFWARSAAIGEKVDITVGQSSGTYQSYGSGFFDVTTQWKKYSTKVYVPENNAAARVSFNLGNDTGTVWLDDVVITVIDTMDDSWYNQAEQRIDTIRKGDFSIQLTDNLGSNLSGCSISATLRSHAFEWGTALALTDVVDANEQWYRATASRYFNHGVFENDFKWPYVEPAQDSVQYGHLDKYFDWADTAITGIRGHALLWGGQTSWQTPAWLFGLTPAEALARVKMRVQREVSYFKGEITDYDVVNEMIHEPYVANLVGDSIYRLCFEWARQADPAAKLYINDYNILMGNSTSNYTLKIKELLNQGTPIDGIGMQGHFFTPINWKDVKLKLDIVAEAGLPMKVTEFDINLGHTGISQQEQADQYATFMRTIFSYPNMEGFYFWGFWDSRQWQNSGFFDAQRNPKIAADSVYHLIHEHWTTQESGVTDASGELNFRGFYGTYQVDCDCQGARQSYMVTLDKSTLDSTLVLNTSTGISGMSTKPLTLFPNPTNGQLRIEGAVGSSAQVVNTEGRIVATILLEEKTQPSFVDLSNFQSGVYLIRTDTQRAVLVVQ